MILETLLVSLVPAGLDLLKGAGGALSRKFFGLSVDDQIKLETAQVGKLQAIAALDNPYGEPSKWVVNLRASFRYIAASAIILIGTGVLVLAGYQYNLEDADSAMVEWLVQLGLETVGTPFFFIFGERMWQGIKGAPR